MKKTILTIGTIAVVTFGGAFATSNSSVYAQQTLDEVNSQQEDVKSKLSNAEAEIADVLYEIKDINADIDRLEIALDENKEQIEKNKKKIDKLQEDIDELNERIEKRNDILKDRISSYQENGGNINYLEVFLGSKNFSEFVSRLSAVNSITNADADLIEENEKDKAAVEEKLDEQEKATQELETQKETIATQKEQKKESKSELKEKEEQVKNEKAALENESSELAALESDIRASIEAANEPQVAAETTENPETEGNSDPEENNNSNNNETTESNNDSNNNSNNNSSNNSNSNANTSSSNNTATASASSNNGSTSSSNNSAPAKKKPTKVNSTPTGGGSATSVGQQFIGNSTYSWGSQNPAKGLFDCSGFTQWAFQQEGISLPRSTGGQASAGKGVSYSQAQPGDLVFFLGGSHVGIYIGGGKFIGSQSSTGVAIADMNSGYWAQNFDNKVRRVR